MSTPPHPVEWALRGVVIVATGLLPLSITSQPVLAWLTAFGTGRLIASGLTSFFWSIAFGAAGSTIAPRAGLPLLPPVAAAITHIAGILSMLVAERRLSSRALDASRSCELDSDTSSSPTSVAHAMELRERKETEDTGARPPASRTKPSFGPHQCRIYLFIFAFVVREIVRGISVGHRPTSPPWKSRGAIDDKVTRALPGPVVVFFLRAAPEVATALGFATTLLSASLPIAECRRYVLLYGAVNPLVALLSHAATALLQIVPTKESKALFVLFIMKYLSIGFFVYAALILRMLIVNSRTTARTGLLARVFLMAVGALLPNVLPMLIGILITKSKLAANEKLSHGTM